MKRFFSLLLSLTMVFTMFTGLALAEGYTDGTYTGEANGMGGAVPEKLWLLSFSVLEGGQRYVESACLQLE